LVTLSVHPNTSVHILYFRDEAADQWSKLLRACKRQDYITLSVKPQSLFRAATHPNFQGDYWQFTIWIKQFYVPHHIYRIAAIKNKWTT